MRCNKNILLVGLLYLYCACASAANIENVRVWRAPDNTRLVFDLSSATEHKLLNMPGEQGNAQRIVVILPKAQFSLNWIYLWNNMSEVFIMENKPNMGNQQNRSECIRLMQNLSEADFYALDLKLYLDTHPHDCKAIELFREATKQATACREAFEKCCYPLLASSAGMCDECTWDWLFGAWPSEKM